jgi:hypothetical protein
MNKIISLILSLSLFSMLGVNLVQAQTVGIRVIFPAGGEQFQVGGTQVLTWSTSLSISKVNLSVTSYLPCMYTAPICSVQPITTTITTNVFNNGAYSWSIPTNFVLGSYILNIEDAAGSTVEHSNVFSIFTSNNFLGQNYHVSGTNILSNQAVYYVQAQPFGINNQPVLVPYSSAQVFNSYKTNSWERIEQANSADMSLVMNSSIMPFADGTLVNDSGTVYVISNGYKNGIVSPKIFLGLNYKWTNLVNTNISFMPNGTIIDSVNAHMPGSLVKQGQTISYISAAGKINIPSMTVFNSWKFNLKDIVVANASDNILGINSQTPIAGEWTNGLLKLGQ